MTLSSSSASSIRGPWRARPSSSVDSGSGGSRSGGIEAPKELLAAGA
eukprot:CAMPEP_0205937992 /NCGR_PEP_ID=MMETSP1325-20131115/45689_1 /ASSEMBLY_ACC=CAM_ASM_000708 /TAXON_ID=236786 /ORGANISM="Florenciella sp., Strain RCC1007" /LENGTH=46 /DNA_ID= /DNA_START= /DNA_END= /DNA_ORIENTATION=